MPGDVYVSSDDKAYILIGQDCDMMIAEKRKRRVAASELLPVKELIAMNTSEKIHNDTEYVWLANYRHIDDQVYCMKIDYKHRRFIDSRILDLCTYNSNGECILDTKNGIKNSANVILQPYLVDRYEGLRTYFEAISQLSTENGDVLKMVLANDQYLFTSDEFEQIDEGLRFPLKRVCRIKQTCVFFLYKLYLEYRGRQPFETINYAASQPRSIDVVYTDKIMKTEFAIRMGSYSHDDRVEKLTWRIQTKKMCQLFRDLGIDEKIDEKEDILVFKGKTTEIPLQSGKRAKFVKKKGNKADLQIC